MSSELQSDVCSGGAIWWVNAYGVVPVWLIGAVVCSLAAYRGSLLFVSSCNGRPHLALQHHWLLPINWLPLRWL